MVAIWIALATSAAGASQVESLEALKKLSLEDLINVEVTIANKTPKKLTEVAAAVFVITPNDICRSGATSLPQVLRMVPGMQVGRIDNRNWAVAMRGPGATLWGANAVNGIINIITRSAHDTADTLLGATAGDHSTGGLLSGMGDVSKTGVRIAPI